MISFESDYNNGCHEAILRRLMETNGEQATGYGLDDYCTAAKAKIRAACGCPEADVFFLVGGTQTNATVIDAMLQSYEGVLSVETGHINVHESGAIEFGTCDGQGLARIDVVSQNEIRVRIVITPKHCGFDAIDFHATGRIKVTTGREHHGVDMTALGSGRVQIDLSVFVNISPIVTTVLHAIHHPIDITIVIDHIR